MRQVVDRTGEEALLNCGLKAVITNYRSSKDFDILVDNSITMKCSCYHYFKNGKVGGNTLNNYLKRKQYIGQREKMNCGMMATIVDYIDYQNITVQFEDNTIVYSRKYEEFKSKNIANPNLGINAAKVKSSRLGTRRQMKCGLWATVIRYGGANDIDVEFEDGVVVTDRTWRSFDNGGIDRKDFQSLKGKSSIMNCGMLATVIEDTGYYNIKIIFEDKTIVTCDRGSFNRGSVANPSLGQRATVLKKNRIGSYNLNNSGISMCIDKYINCDDIVVRFEDGLTKKTLYNSFINGQVKHDTLCLRGEVLNKDAKFGNFCVNKLVYKDKKKVYYLCTCKNCSLTTVLTPSEMLEHTCEE